MIVEKKEGKRKKERCRSLIIVSYCEKLFSFDVVEYSILLMLT